MLYKMKFSPLFLVITVISCNNFENKFYSEINIATKNYNQTKEKQLFDFTKIADFDWDYFQYVRGNESVPVFSEEIEKDLNLNFKTTDLDLNKTRFYFFKKDKLVKEIEINSPDFKTPYFIIESCNDNKIKRSESKFYMTKLGEIYLKPNCIK